MKPKGASPQFALKPQAEQPDTPHEPQHGPSEIGGYLFILAAALLVLVQIVACFRGDRMIFMSLAFLLLLLIVVFPAAIPRVLSATGTAGARLITRKESPRKPPPPVEDLCSAEIPQGRKIDALTPKPVALSDPFALKSAPPEQAILYAALALQAEAAITRARHMGSIGNMVATSQTPGARKASADSLPGQSGRGAMRLPADKQPIASVNTNAPAFAQIFPEHNDYVDQRYNRESTPGMTRDTQNDARSHQQANARIALSGGAGTNDAIASMAVLAGGLPVIFDALRHSSLNV